MNVLKIRNVLQNIYDETSLFVSHICDLTLYELHNSRSELSVTARAAMIYCLIRRGLSEGDISKASGMSQQRVNSLKNSARLKIMCHSAKIIVEELNKFLDKIVGDALMKNNTFASD